MLDDKDRFEPRLFWQISQMILETKYLMDHERTYWKEIKRNLWLIRRKIVENAAEIDAYFKERC